MTQSESCVYLIRELLQEAPRYSSLSIPIRPRKKLLRFPFQYLPAPSFMADWTQKDQALLSSCFTPALLSLMNIT